MIQAIGRKIAIGDVVKYITSGEARKMLSIEGNPINARTFERLIDEGLLESPGYLETTKTRLFERDSVTALVKLLPKKRMASRHSIIDHLKEQLKAKR